MEKDSYAALKKDLIYCKLLSQKFCLYLEDEKLVSNYYKVIWNHS